MRTVRGCDLAERYDSGKLIYSGFQRDYFWSKKSVIEFLNATYRQLVLPSALMVYENALPTEPGSRKRVPVGDGIWHVVDGKQRMETLLRIVRNEEAMSIMFNPYEQKFRFASVGNRNNKKWIPLAELFSQESSQIPRLPIDQSGHFEVNIALQKAHGIFRHHEFPCIHILGYSYQKAEETFLFCNRIRREHPIR